ncbi:MAG TPA: hypothetical protein VL326_36835 [Kofleriaceae bacterium]|nr:hypothetical protein [Kofleriaceae bacterium]
MTRAPCLLLVATLAACGGDDSSSTDPLGGSLTVTGSVVDFQSGTALDVAAMVSTTALDPAPTITTTGSMFTIDGVPENSAFQILATAAPTHHATYSPAVTVISDDVDGVKAYSVSETFLQAMATGFNVTPSATKGILLIHLVDGQGMPKSGVAASNILIANAAGSSAPKFLDAQMAPAPNATASSASGWVVVFDLPAGVVDLGTAATATATLAMPTSPVAAGAITIAEAVVTDGMPAPLPTNVSFATQVYPIFSARGCVACHSGGGPGKDLGGLMLDAGANKVYMELTTENPLRVQKTMPEKSLVLTMPSAESPSDGHPNVTFTGPQDADYLKILVWIREGAKNN